MEEAAVGGQVVAVLRSIFHAAATGRAGFLVALLLFTGYTVGASFIAVAALKPVFPNNVGLWLLDGVRIGAEFPAADGVAPLGGY